MADLDGLIQSVLTQESASDVFYNAVTSLATLSREQEDVRARLASKDVLQRLLEVLSSHPKYINAEEFLATVLRCVGNACVSNPEACQIVTEFKLDWCKAFLKGFPCQWTVSEENATSETDADVSVPFPMPAVSTRDLAIKALYNICSQSEEAQKQCYHDDIHTLVIEAMFDNQHFGAEWTSEMLSLTVDLLLWITSHHKALASFEGDTERRRGLGKNKALKTDAFYWLIKAPLSCANKLDVDDWASLLETCLVFLRDPLTHSDLVSWELFHVVWNILQINESKIQGVEGNAEDEKLLIALSTSLTWVLSDVAVTPEFAGAYADSTKNVLAMLGGTEVPVLKQLIQDLTKLLSNGELPSLESDVSEAASMSNDESLRLTTAACQVIGNLLHSLIKAEGDVPVVIKEGRMHERLFALMAKSDNADFLHSAAGLIIQLSRPSVEARQEIGRDSNALPAIKHLGQHKMQELNQDALMLMRALGKEAPENQERFKELAGEVMATVAEAQKAAAEAQTGQASLEGTS